METPEKTIIEINGIKLEVDLRGAKVIENYKIGDNVRLLEKGYDNKYDVYPGVIVAFDQFKKLPTIVIAYLKISYSSAEIEFAYLNDQTAKEGKFEIAPANYIDEVHFKKASVLESMDKQVTKLKNDMEEVETKRAYFLHHFGKYFKHFETEVPA